jgi:predicted nucleic acid-binding protein
LIYADTSLLAAYYCPEPLSERAQRLLRRESAVGVSDIVEVELVLAIARKARRGEMTRTHARMAHEAFLQHLAQGWYLRWPMERGHFLRAREWLALTPLPLLALDALHLAVASAHQAPVATCDRQLASSARKLGVRARLVTASP